MSWSRLSLSQKDAHISDKTSSCVMCILHDTEALFKPCYRLVFNDRMGLVSGVTRTIIPVKVAMLDTFCSTSLTQFSWIWQVNQPPFLWRSQMDQVWGYWRLQTICSTYWIGWIRMVPEKELCIRPCKSAMIPSWTVLGRGRCNMTLIQHPGISLIDSILPVHSVAFKYKRDQAVGFRPKSAFAKAQAMRRQWVLSWSG